MENHQRVGGADMFGDALHGDARQALLGDELDGGVDDALDARFAALAPAVLGRGVVRRALGRRSLAFSPASRLPCVAPFSSGLSDLRRKYPAA